ncbi:hypothetical protein GDO81_002358 [Engystomops pustulosus]|uniref:Secreted protein n=1 Tax=Engystomops pustulosus TaxID=76066 RepID=A0AAV7DJJ6_ENGPU|nr:hypothetical protein GDO81_002358 [Engystomops pustulosus]
MMQFLTVCYFIFFPLFYFLGSGNLLIQDRCSWCNTVIHKDIALHEACFFFKRLAKHGLWILQQERIARFQAGFTSGPGYEMHTI